MLSIFGLGWLPEIAVRAMSWEKLYGGRCRIRTCDFHRVKVALYR